ncbi:MAG: 2OG-Fe(II) oxygenase [Bacteroidetes bacterium]|nr:2OG-Fe(II) oxygenase [Bacteroidota bacterium]
MKLDHIDWDGAHASIHEKGFVILKNILDQKECDDIISLYQQPTYFRKTISMERYRFGLGEYKYLQYPLPGIIETLRKFLYQHLCVIANDWNNMLNIAMQYPSSHADFINICRSNDQSLATPLILKYGAGGHNTLHQDLYGKIYFPLQAVVFLNKAGEDYDGGEFVLTEQIPRAQSKAIVLQPGHGDLLIFTTQFRPQKGARGYYRVNMKHGVSVVHSGNRHTLGIIFHDAQ